MDRTAGPYAVADTGFRGPDVKDYNRPPQGQPGLWCDWTPTDDGSAIRWNGTEKFRKENPKTYKAFVDALAEAARFASDKPEQSADIFLRTNNSKLDRDFLIKIIKNPEVQFKLTPQNTYALADFMHRVGAIKNRPASAKDYFFDDAHNAAGS